MGRAPRWLGSRIYTLSRTALSAQEVCRHSRAVFHAGRRLRRSCYSGMKASHLHKGLHMLRTIAQCKIFLRDWFGLKHVHDIARATCTSFCDASSPLLIWQVIHSCTADGGAYSQVHAKSPSQVCKTAIINTQCCERTMYFFAYLLGGSYGLTQGRALNIASCQQQSAVIRRIYLPALRARRSGSWYRTD